MRQWALSMAKELTLETTESCAEPESVKANNVASAETPKEEHTETPNNDLRSE